MAKLTTAFATSHRLWVAAMEEASRGGGKDAGLDHLLLALTIDDGAAGQVLRASGVTIERAREAIAAQHREQLSSLGLDVETLSDGPISLGDATGFDWTEQARAAMARATAIGETGDSAAVLRALLAEPSGFVTAVLRRLDTTPESIGALLAQAVALPVTAPTASSDDLFHRSTTAFLPATPDATWALVSDPRRLAEWDATTETVTPGAAGSWIAPPQDGRAVDLGPQHFTVDADESRRVAHWTFWWPASVRRTNRRHVIFALEPEASGTSLRVDTTWETASARKRRRVSAARPFFRALMWFQVTRVASSVSAALRG
ncbi:SRPBCC family protein [Microbacterium testaceum]|nr:Clp protease N-terminal domain-containing protein [Microbacterium testaceum]